MAVAVSVVWVLRAWDEISWCWRSLACRWAGLESLGNLTLDKSSRDSHHSASPCLPACNWDCTIVSWTYYVAGGDTLNCRHCRHCRSSPAISYHILTGCQCSSLGLFVWYFCTETDFYWPAAASYLFNILILLCQYPRPLLHPWTPATPDHRLGPGLQSSMDARLALQYSGKISENGTAGLGGMTADWERVTQCEFSDLSTVIS